MSDSGFPRSSSDPGPTPAPAGAPAYDRASEVGIDEPRYDQTARDAPPRVRYVICATQRSGSFLLARQLLNAGLGVPQEYFHPLHAGALAARWGVDPADRAGYVRALFRRRTTPNGVWGTKLQWWQYRDWRAELDALVLGGAKILYLYRSDVAAQAVSLHLSHVTGVWGPDGTKTTAGEPPERLRDVAGVREAEAMIRSETAAWEQYFADRRVDPPAIRYEDFVRDQPGTVERVARCLGLSAGEYRVPPPEPKATPFPPEVEAARADLLRRHREGGEAGGAPHERPSASPATPPRPAIRGASVPLPVGFPRFQAYVVTYHKNLPSAVQTVADFRQSDWGENPIVFAQPETWPVGFESAARNYKRALEHAAADGCDFALVLEDDVRVCRHLRHNLTTLPLVRRDQCDFLSLYVPDLVQAPWDREESHLGYRLAKPLYSGPNRMWQKYRLWGSQGYLLSRRFVLAALDRWDRLARGLDTRVLSVCAELKLPLWYTAPCLVEHAPVTSAHGTPTAHAPDFDPDFRLDVGPGFQPPEAVPGWLTVGEGRALWGAAAGRSVLELGTGWGRSTVCLAQRARRVVSVDAGDQAEAAEWVRRFEVTDRVEFRRGDVAGVCGGLAGERFGLAFVDTEHDAASVARDVQAVLPLVEPGGLVAFHDYPDPGWPDVRRVVDGYARRLGWRRVAQAGYLGVFET